MKKSITVFFAVLMMVLSSVTTFAAEKSEVFFDSYSSENGEKIVVEVKITENNASMLQFCVSYDSSVLGFVSANAGDAFSGNSAPIINATDGKIFFIWDSLTPLGTEGTMLYLEFIPIQEKDTTVEIDKTESFIVANSKFEDIGSIKGSAKIDLSDEESTESVPDSSVSAEPEEPEESEPEAESSAPDSSEDVDISETISEKIEAENNITEEDKTVWESGDENIVKIEEGEIVPVSPGTTTITVTTEDGEKEAEVEVIVTEDGTIEVITNEAREKNMSGLIFIPVVLVLTVVSLVLIKHKKVN